MVENYSVKKTVYDKLVTKVNGIDTKIPTTSGLVNKTQHVLNKQDLEKKKLKMLTKRYVALVGWSRRLITTQKLHRLKTRHLVLLV